MADRKNLPEAPSPESVGISSRALLRFLDRLEAERLSMHGILVMRRGAVAAEGYWQPFTADRPHRMYSVSKSFVSLAVGCMAGEGRLSLDDRVAQYFPDKAPTGLHPYVARATVRDLLMMATPHRETSYGPEDDDWAWTFFNRIPDHLPGTVFNYDTAATVVLGTIVERLAGMPFLEYLRPRLLDPTGFSPYARCIQTPEGTSWGGSGVLCTLRDMARMALLCMNGGRWGGRQLIPADYIHAATTRQIDNAQLHGNHGYGYQIWIEDDGGFSFRGMGSQLAYCWPGRDFLFCCTADTQGDGGTGVGVVDAMRREILENLRDEPLPEDAEGLALLRARLADLRWLPPAGEADSPAAARVSGKWYAMDRNAMGITSMRFTFGDGGALWEYDNGQGRNRLRLGIGSFAADRFPQRNYFGPRIGVTPGIQYECLSSAAWAEENKLNAVVYITDDYLGTLRMTVVFTGDEITVWMAKVAEWFLDEYEGFASGKMTTVE